MKKVLIISEQFSSNLGDGIIYDVVYNYLKNNCVIDSLDLSGREKIDDLESSNMSESTLKKIGYKNTIKKVLKKVGIYVYGSSLRATIKIYKEELETKILEFKPNFVLFAGGQLFTDSFLEQIKYTVEFCSKKNIKVIFNACGSSNIGNYYEKRMIKSIVNNKAVVYVSLRDHFDEIKKLDKDKKVYDTYDTAILCSEVYNIKVTKEKEYGLGIMLSSSISYREQFDFWKNIICFLEQNEKKYGLFCNGSVDDYNFAKSILKSLDLNLNILAPKPRSPEELVQCINKYDKIISMRLHSLIIAYSYDIPALALSWNKKVDEFYNKINKNDYCLSFSSNIEIVKSKIDLNKDFLDIDKKSEIIDDIHKNLEKILRIIE